jgi:hypothetical protein
MASKPRYDAEPEHNTEAVGRVDDYSVADKADPEPSVLKGHFAEPTSDTAALERTIKLTASIIAPTTILTALLLYFGYARTNALYSWFGIDASTLGFSTQDYLIRSAEAVYLPVGALLGGMLLLWWMHNAVSARLSSGDRRPLLVVIAVLLGVAGVALLARGIAGVIWPWLSRNDFLVTPLCLGVGILFVSYALYMRNRLNAGKSGSGQPGKSDSGQPGKSDSAQPSLSKGAVGSSLVVMLILLSIFWMTTNYAEAYGRGFASQLGQRLETRPAVTIYSMDRLYLHGTGVIEHRISRSAGAYHYEYTGLRLLIQSRGRYFLLPAGWDRQRDATMVVTDNDRLRFEFRSGG